jgi:hypothetical protein
MTSTFPGVASTLPFQPGTNFKLRSTVGVELVVQLPIVQAPFRIYWGYNLNRMAQIITAPPTQFPGNVNDPNDPNWNPYRGGLSPEVFQSQVLQGGANGGNGLINIFNHPQATNFFDPVRTFRFTVSRTF